ncbi:helix-turn-helix transcriptional regulator [Halorarius litoreus]|uniref:helix-turn-helix transcriptional regulator n=1 Tax=Halorarius litoreus TaxID=2962676 RepID=UPI0020CEF3A4|nr:hypothetical protein [Halorarius litoreus]
MTSTPLDDVSFLARSDHRVEVLRTLAPGARSRPELHAETEIPQPTLGRVLGSFEDRNWVERRNGEYALTAAGALVAAEFTDLLDTVETVQRLGDVLVQLPTDEMAFDVRAFADATVWTPEPGDTLSHIRRMEETWLEADRKRLLGGTLGPASFEQRRDNAREFVEREMRAETVVSTAMMERGMSDPELNRLVREHWDPERMVGYLYDGPIPLILAIADDTAMLAPTDENGIPTAVVVTENEAVRAWVDDRIDEYREQATELTFDDLPP